jgi:NifU-like protein involved in Fe-S cluster formation
MSDLDDIYNAKILDLAANISRTTRLSQPDASASARSRLCGSEISIDLDLRDGRVTDYGQTVKACLLGQAAASIMAREIVGSTPADLRAVAARVRAMLKDNGAPPAGAWSDLEVLEPVRDYKHRHDAVLIVFDVVEKALTQIEAKASV